MEALYIQPLEEDGVMMLEEERGESGEQEEAGTEASYPTGSTTDEETDEDSEPEPPPVVRRKVSFADAFGLNLVSVKEFDNVDVTESDVSQPPEGDVSHLLEQVYMSCLFTVPSSPEELDQRLQGQMVELESIELLPGTTTLRGIIRVVNLCYSKSVYVRITLDRWKSYFDLLAEYVPGSSDRKTDRFTFKYTLIPPFEREGTRVEFSLCYQTSMGTFWANNKEMNYVLFCHQKGHVKEHGPQAQEESTNHKSKRSCLKANRRGSASEKTSNTSAVVPEAEATFKAEEADRKTMDSAEIQLQYHEEHKPLVDSIKSRHRATRLARVQDYFSKRSQQAPKAYSRDAAEGQKVSQPFPTPWAGSARCLQKCQRKPSGESPQVLTYHQIPLLTLDWNNEKAHQWGAADVDDIWTGRAKMTLSKVSVENIEDAASVNDMWVRNGTDDPTDKETSVCDVWQAFLNGPSCMDHSAVPESEWLQTAASVSPSNDKEPKSQYAASSQEHGSQVGEDTPTTLHAHTSAACQLLSDACETPSANVSLNTAGQQPAEACVSSPADDNTVTQDASQRSQTNSETDTLLEFSLKGATPVSEGSVDSSTECHKHAIWEREREGIIGGAGGTGRDEPFTPHAADLVTSSGESETTDMTAMAESQNVSAVDRISRGAGLDEGLSSRREGEATGTAHNATDDTLAFRGTIRQGTKDGERFVFSTSRQGVQDEGIMNNCTENKAPTEEEIFKPQETEECEASQRCTDEKQWEDFRLNQNSENPLREKESDKNEIRPAQSHAYAFNPNQMCEDNFEQSETMAGEFKLDESENEEVASNNEDLEVFKKTEVEPSHCRTSEETKRLIGVEAEIIQVLNEEEWQHNDKAFKPNSSWRSGNTEIISEVDNKQPRPIQAGEELRIQSEEDSLLTQTQENTRKCETGEHVLVSNQPKEGKSSSYDRIIEQEVNPSAQGRHTVESRDTKKLPQSDRDTFGPFESDKWSLNPVEMVEMKWIHSEDNIKGQKEDVGREISPEEDAVNESIAKKGTSTEVHCQPETFDRTEEDMSQRGKDERESIRKLKIEAVGELMGDAEKPRGERRSAPAELKEQELSAEVESSPRVEYEKLSKGTKEPFTAEGGVALQLMEPGLEETSVERFGEDLVGQVWEEVFGQKAPAANRDTSGVDRMGSEPADITDITQDCHLLVEKDFRDAFDSGVFSLIELPTTPNSSLCRGPEQTSATESSESSPKDGSQSLTAAQNTHFPPETQTDLSSSARLTQDLTPILASQSRQPPSESAQSSPKDQESYTHIKERSVSCQESGRQIDDCVVAHRESFNRSAHPSHKHPSHSSEKLKEQGFMWWSLLYILSHITRLLICVLLVAGFFFIVFPYDFPAFFALYIFSLCGWFYKWKRYREKTNKGIAG